MTRQNVTFKQDWIYRTPMVTISYKKGGAQVNDEVAQAAKNAGVLENADRADNQAGSVDKAEKRPKRNNTRS